MKISEYTKNELKKIQQKSPKERWEYFWDYYKWPVLAVMLAVLLLVQTVIGMANKKELVFYGFVLNSRVSPQDDALLQGFYEYAGIDSDKQEAAIYSDITLKDGSAKGDTASFQRIMAGIATKETDFLVGQAAPFRLFAYSTSRIFLDLRNFLDADTLAQFSDRLYYIDGAVLELLDAPLGEQVDSTIEYPDPTKPETMKDPIPVGIDISDRESFHSAYYIADNALYFGVISNTPRLELTRTFLEYLFS